MGRAIDMARLCKRQPSARLATSHLCIPTSPTDSYLYRSYTMHWIDPECLLETRGTVTQFLLNPHGEPDGFILGNDRQVHFPPHMARQVTKLIGIGDKVRVRGVKPRGAGIVAAVQVTSSTGVKILDEGPHHGDEKHE